MIGTKVLEERKSKFNGRIEVVRGLGLGTYIQVNGLTQSGGVVEEIWRNTLCHIKHYPLDVKHCLVLGLGGGTVAKLIYKFWPGAKITGVDIDPIMVELGAKYLKLDVDKIKIIIGDAKKFKIDKKYDLIIVDTYLGDKGVEIIPEKADLVVFNKLFYGDKRKKALKFGERLKRIFKRVDYFYPGANLMFLCYNK